MVDMWQEWQPTKQSSESVETFRQEMGVMGVGLSGGDKNNQDPCPVHHKDEPQVLTYWTNLPRHPTIQVETRNSNK